ncbi:MAG TPA: biopolymer transporter ExbD [Gammaproteobacteria bacterium]|nr:biopolymer transporter ExbD [Gammaproteobacteria bacterium]
MRARFRRRSFTPPTLDITAFLNLMVILVPFLLITAVFSHLSILELNIPPSVENTQTPEEDLALEIIIRPDMLQVGFRQAGIIAELPRAGTEHDYPGLTEVLKKVKARFPDKVDATILAEPDTAYDTLIHVMDATRTVDIVRAGSVVKGELFPALSVGDAPPLTAGEETAQ